MTKCKVCTSKCCRYFALEIDTPESREDFENIKWYLAHENVEVFVDEGKWYLDVKNKCRYLTYDHKCAIYDKRPEICRGHSNEECEHDNSYFGHDHIFTDIYALDEYLKHMRNMENEHE